MRHIDLFSGIGGFALATEMTWPEEVDHIFCDNEPFAQKILQKHWPKAPIISDIRLFTTNSHSDKHRTLKKTIYETQKIQGISRETLDTRRFVGADILTGGFPCQPFSQAGRRLGTEDDRHLWPEMLRVIREFKPRWVIGENVGGLVTWNTGMVLEQVYVDLEAEGYEVQAFIIPAVALNAPHRRDRIWIVAHSKHKPTGNSEQRGNDKRPSNRATRSDKNAPDTASKGLQQSRKTRCSSETGSTRRRGFTNDDSWSQNWLEVATRLCTLDDGLPNGLARPRGW